jgi:hypothetical protein
MIHPGLSASMGLKANQLNPSPKLTGVINRAESLQQTKE